MFICARELKYGTIDEKKKRGTGMLSINFLSSELSYLYIVKTILR